MSTVIETVTWCRADVGSCICGACECVRIKPLALFLHTNTAARTQDATALWPFPLHLSCHGRLRCAPCWSPIMLHTHCFPHLFCHRPLSPFFLVCTSILPRIPTVVPPLSFSTSSSQNPHRHHPCVWCVRWTSILIMCNCILRAGKSAFMHLFYAALWSCSISSKGRYECFYAFVLSCIIVL